MRTDLEGATLTYTPKAQEGTPETTTEKIPYETKREFDPKWRLVQKKSYKR